MSLTPAAFSDAVTDIQKWLGQSPLPGEAVVRQAIVLRLLQAAGFDIWNPAEVVPEETTKTGSRADFLIRTCGGKFALELKSMNVSLSPKDYEQVATYAANESTRWAILTNGLVWSVMDTTHNAAQPFHEREILKIEWDTDNIAQVADDLFSLLSAEIWTGDRFETTVKNLRRLQQKRKNIAEVIKDKMREVIDFQSENTIASFEKAVFLYAQFGKITEEERDILISAQDNKNKTIEVDLEETILFRLKYGKLKAQAKYDLKSGKWTLLKGSEMSLEIKAHAGKAVFERRDKLNKEGKIQESGGCLILMEEIVYQTPSAAAGVLAGDSMSGWDCWIDENGISAQSYRQKGN